MIIEIRIKEILEEKNKTKYWFIKNMEGGYQALSRLMNNETSSIHFETILRICELLNCTPGDIIVIKEKL